MDDFRRVAIVGAGLIGGSLGLAIKARPNAPAVIGYNRRRETSALAKRLGAIDAAEDTVHEAVAEADLVFVATPVGAILDTFELIAPHLAEGAIVTDVGSTKAEIVREGERILPPSVHFIGGHPMAGSEREGVANASATLFVNAYYLLTPTPQTDTTAFGRLHSLLSELGATVLAIEPEAHDRAVATISHVPHLLSTALVNLAGGDAERGDTVLRIAAGGFKDMTRVAAGNAQMWADICLTNSEAVLGVMNRLRDELDRLSGAIEAGDREALTGALEEAKGLRSRLPALWQRAAVPMCELHVPVIDRPGVISEITLTIGELDVNIEDIELAHASEAAATLKLVVEKGPNLDKAVAALKAKGYDAQVIEIGEG